MDVSLTRRLFSVTVLTAVLAGYGCSSYATRQSHAGGGYDPGQQVEMLRELRDKGLLTEAEFEAKKKRVLERN
jgi:hypothetical protein